MAVVSQIYTLEFYIEDAKGEPSNISIFIGSEAGEIDISKLAAAATAFYGYLAPLVNGQIRRASAKIDLITEIAGSPAAGSDNRLGAIFMLFSNADQRKWIIRIPTFNQTLTTNVNTVRVSTTNTNVVNLWNAWRLGFVVDGLTYKAVTENGHVHDNSFMIAALDYQLNASRRRR